MTKKNSTDMEHHKVNSRMEITNMAAARNMSIRSFDPTVVKIKETKVFSVALEDALTKDNVSKWSGNMLRLYGIIVLLVLNDCMNGFDGSLMGAMNGMTYYHTYFNIDKVGSSTGIVFAIYAIGNLTGAWFAAPIADRFGRKWGMFSGCSVIVLGTVVEATAPALNIGQFMGGRYLIGFGITVAMCAAPTYLVEIAYPKWRGLFGGLYNVCGWYIGALVCSWMTYGTSRIESDWSWRIPVICQGIPALIVMISVMFIPESPRWLFANGRPEEARQVLIKYHGNGNPDSAVVELECREIEAAINHDVEMADKRWWDYRPLFNSRPALYRLWLLVIVVVFSQFIGGSVISYYLTVIVADVGITESRQQLLLNALNTVFSFMGGIVGCTLVDRFGRRQLFIWGTFATGCCYIVMNVIASRKDYGPVSTGAGYTFIAAIYCYGIFFSMGWTPLQALYPAEILTNEMRAKGMAFKSFAGGIAGFINLWATPVALKQITWKTYTIFLVLHFVELFLVWKYIVETRGRSIEEIEEIFEDPHPVKRSLHRTTIVVVPGAGVKVEMED